MEIGSNPAMLGAIDAARERIVFETYVYNSGEVANRFTSALERAAQRGVDVSVIVDAVGAAGMDADHIDRLTVTSRELAARFTSDFETDLRRSTRLELEKWRQRSTLQKAREKFWSWFGEVF